MVTNNVSHVSHTGSVQESRPAIRVPTERKKQENAGFLRRQLWKWFGVISTLLIGSAVLAPNAFGVPIGLRPWVFLTSILWFFAFCAGMFDL